MSYKKRSNEDDLPKAIKNMKKQRLREEIEVDKNKKARHGKRKNNKNFNKKKKIKKIVLITMNNFRSFSSSMEDFSYRDDE